MIRSGDLFLALIGMVGAFLMLLWGLCLALCHGCLAAWKEAVYWLGEAKRALLGWLQFLKEALKS